MSVRKAREKIKTVPPSCESSESVHVLRGEGMKMPKAVNGSSASAGRTPKNNSAKAGFRREK